MRSPNKEKKQVNISTEMKLPYIYLNEISELV